MALDVSDLYALAWTLTPEIPEHKGHEQYHIQHARLRRITALSMEPFTRGQSFVVSR